MRSVIVTPLLALAVPAMAGGVETVQVSDLKVHRQGSPVGDTIESVSFRLNGANAKNLLCSTKTEFDFPEPIEIFPCGKSDYSFALFEGENGADFATMIYHDVGDSHADLRGHADVETECDNSHGSGPADLTCKQKGDAVEFVIDGPVGDHPGMGDGPHRGDL